MTEAVIGLLGVIVGLLAGHWSAKRIATDNRWWDRRFEAYKEGMEICTALMQVHEEYWDYHSSVTLFIDSYLEQLGLRKRDAHFRLLAMCGVAQFLLTDRATTALIELAATVASNDQPDPDDHQKIQDAAKQCYDVLIDDANTVLGRHSPRWFSAHVLSPSWKTLAARQRARRKPTGTVP